MKLKTVYSFDTLVQLCQLETRLLESRQEAERTRQLVGEAVERIQRIQHLRRELELRRASVERQQARLIEYTGQMEQASDAVEELTVQNMDRRVKLKRATHRRFGEIKRQTSKLRQDRIILEDVRAMLARQRAAMATQLLNIFPIELDFQQHSNKPELQIAVKQEEDTYAGWSICGQRIVGPDHIKQWQMSEETAAALGLVAQLIHLLSCYLSIPLRFPIIPRGSRSVICNPNAKSSSLAELPLYMLRAIERPQMQAALRLLTTDIVQLLYVHGIDGDEDRHRILPNLTQLLMAVEGCSFVV